MGDENNIRSTLSSLESRYNNIKQAKSDLEIKLIEAESFIKIVDPDGSIQDKYNNIYEEVNKYNIQLSNIEQSLSLGLYNKILIEEDEIINKYESELDNITRLENIIDNDFDKLNDIILKREEDIHVFEIKKQKIYSIKMDQDVDKLRNIV